eukprot:11214571-Lingulodinium_polyedra.AAC.1
MQLGDDGCNHGSADGMNKTNTVGDMLVPPDMFPATDPVISCSLCAGCRTRKKQSPHEHVRVELNEHLSGRLCGACANKRCPPAPNA